MYAARNGHQRMVDLLMQRGAEIKLQNSIGGTALLGAAGQGHEGRVVDLLLRGGAEVELQNNHGFTALMFPPREATSERSSCCCSAARRSTSRASTASPR